MTTKAYSLFIILVAMLCFHTFATAQVRRDTPITSVAALECSFTKNMPATNLKEMATSQMVNATPIPSNGLVKVSDLNYDRYSVTDTQGEMWVAGPGTSDRTIDLGHLPSGVYYLHLTSKDGEVVREMLKGK